MALEFDETDTTHYRSLAFGGVGSAWTLSCWVYLRTFATATQNVPIFLGGNGVGVPLTDQRLLQIQKDTGEVRAQINSAAGGADWASDTTNLTINNWHFICAQFLTATSRYVWVDTNKSSENTASNSPAAPERVSIASADDNTPNRWFTGILAECAVWGKNIGDDAIQSLASGLNPITVDPGNLWAYYPLIRDTRAPFGTELTQVGSSPPVTSPHPRVFGRPTVRWFESAVPPRQDVGRGQVDRTGAHRRARWGMRWQTGALPYNPGG